MKANRWNLLKLLILAWSGPAFGQPSDNPPLWDSGGPPPPPGMGRPGGPPGGRGAASRKLHGVFVLSGKTERAADLTYRSASNDVSAVYVRDGGALSLSAPTVITSGDTSSQESSSFFGLNAAVLATQGSQISISGGSVTTTGSGANGVFATGAGARITLSNFTINATGPGGHGVMATAGGTLTLTDVDMTTGPGANSAAVATDRGGGTISVTRGKIVTSGRDAPGIYSTGTITAEDATFEATGAEAAVIEGRNSISLTNCHLSGAVKRGVMVYQSFSGDALGRKGTFTMVGGSLKAAAGPLFYVSNTKGVITLQGVRASAQSGILVDASAGRWGRTGSNGGQAVFTADAETLTGDLTCDRDSSIAATLQNGTSLTGAIKGGGLALDATSKWTVTGDSILTTLSNQGGLTGTTFTNIYGQGHEVRYDPSLPGNQWLGAKTYALTGGGNLLPKDRP
jgi:hypothetical protein